MIMQMSFGKNSVTIVKNFGIQNYNFYQKYSLVLKLTRYQISNKP